MLLGWVQTPTHPQLATDTHQQTMVLDRLSPPPADNIGLSAILHRANLPLTVEEQTCRKCLWVDASLIYFYVIFYRERVNAFDCFWTKCSFDIVTRAIMEMYFPKFQKSCQQNLHRSKFSNHKLNI